MVVANENDDLYPIHDGLPYALDLPDIDDMDCNHIEMVETVELVEQKIVEILDLVVIFANFEVKEFSTDLV